MPWGGGLPLLHCLRVSGCAAAWYQLVISGHSEMISHRTVPWKQKRAWSDVWMIVNTILEFPEWVFVFCFILGLVLHVEHFTVCQALIVETLCLRPPIKHACTISYSSGLSQILRVFQAFLSLSASGGMCQTVLLTGSFTRPTCNG